MRAAVTDRLLERLTPWQRCGVIFAALAREDFEEADRLADTAPMGTYRAADFFEPFTRAMLVAALARGDIGYEEGKEWQMRCSWATLMHQGRDIETLDRLWEAAEGHRARARALWAAYARAVTDAGLDPAEVMQSMGGLPPLMQEIIEDAEPDPDALELYAGMLG